MFLGSKASDRAARKLINGSPTAVRQALHTSAGMICLHGLAFVTSILIARGLGPAAQGRFQVVLSIAVFVTLVTTAGLDEAVAYLLPRYAVDNPEKTRALITYVLCTTGVVSVLVGALFFTTAGAVETLLRIAGIARDLKALLLLCPVLMVLSMSLAVLRGLGRSDWRAYINYYIVGGLYLVAVAALAVGGLNAAAAYGARITSLSAGALIALVLIFRHPFGNSAVLDRADLWTLHTLAGWLVFVGMFQYAIEQPLLDLVIVGRYDTPVAVGLYSVAAKVAGVIATGSLALNIVMAPVFARGIAARDVSTVRASYRSASRWVAAMSLLVGGAVLLLHKEVLLLFGEKYTNAGWIVQIFAVAQIAAGLLGLNSPMLIALGRARIEFWITAAGALILVFTGFLLGARFGAAGVAFASAGTTVGVAGARRLAIARVFGQR